MYATVPCAPPPERDAMDGGGRGGRKRPLREAPSVLAVAPEIRLLTRRDGYRAYLTAHDHSGPECDVRHPTQPASPPYATLFRSELRPSRVREITLGRDAARAVTPATRAK